VPIEMTMNQKPDACGIPEARRDFSTQLRELRVPRGYRTARSFARALGIDENRYTRYERAEVEPDLDMIRRICQLLAVTPNELLGTPSPSLGMDGGVAPADTDMTSSIGRAQAHQPQSENRARSIATASWQLAEKVIAVRASHAASASHSLPVAARGLEALSLTGTVYKELMQQPFETIAAISADLLAARIADDDLGELRHRIDVLVTLIKAGSTPV
jgi:transcriptional regulator with XRE-family HTH domain